MPLLVIDDDSAVLDSLATALECHGFRVLTARDGDQGIKVLFREKSLSVVVTDIMMPDRDGIAAMLQMRRESAASFRVPLAALPATGDPGGYGSR